jgi:hypothetical protein|nr:MAG TPA: hypothetical protein [Caudoviricetes sp.]
MKHYLYSNDLYTIVINFSEEVEQKTFQDLIKKLEKEYGKNFSKECLKVELDTLNVNYTISNIL